MKKLTIGIPCKDRTTELCLLLQSLLDQTFQDFDILIIEDSHISNENSERVGSSSFGNVTKCFTFQMLKNLLVQSGHTVSIIEGQRKGPHYAGQMILENAETELIFRIDDDVILRPDCLNELVKSLQDSDVVASGPIYLIPNIPIEKQIIDFQPGLDETMKVVIKSNMIKVDATVQCNIIQNYPSEYVFEAQHLHSGFMYRRQKVIDIGGYCLEYSKVGHREETDLSYRLYLSGGKLRVVPEAICFHFHPPYGGIRCTGVDFNKKELWDHDDRLFVKRFSKLKVKDNISLVVFSNSIENLKNTTESIITCAYLPHTLIIMNQNIDVELFNNYMKKLTEKNPGITIIFDNLKNDCRPKMLNRAIDLIPDSNEYVCFINCDIVNSIGNEEDCFKMLINELNQEVDIAALAYLHMIPELKNRVGTDGILFTNKKYFSKIGKFDTIFNDASKSTYGCDILEWTYRAQSLGYKIKQIKLFPKDNDTKMMMGLSLFNLQKNTLHYVTQYSDKYHRSIMYIQDKYNIKMNKEKQQHLSSEKKLNLGCGSCHLDGFENIDIDSKCNPDIVSDIRDLYYDNNSIKMILIRNTLEHFCLDDIKKLLKKFNMWLQTNGFLIIEVPNVEKIINDISREIVSFNDVKYLILGDENNTYQKHRYQFFKSELTDFLYNVGFYKIEDESNMCDDKYSLRLICQKGVK